MSDCDRNICYTQDYNGGCATCPCNTDVPEANVGKITERQAIEAVYTIRQYCRERYCATDDCAIRDWCQEVCLFGLPEEWTIPKDGEEE